MILIKIKYVCGKKHLARLIYNNKAFDPLSPLFLLQNNFPMQYLFVIKVLREFVVEVKTFLKIRVSTYKYISILFSIFSYDRKNTRLA